MNKHIGIMCFVSCNHVMFSSWTFLLSELYIPAYVANTYRLLMARKPPNWNPWIQINFIDVIKWWISSSFGSFFLFFWCIWKRQESCNGAGLQGYSIKEMQSSAIFGSQASYYNGWYISFCILICYWPKLGTN